MDNRAGAGWERLVELDGEPLVRPGPWWALVVGKLLVWTAVVHIDDCCTAWTFAPWVGVLSRSTGPDICGKGGGQLMVRLPCRPLGPGRDGSGSCERAGCFQDSADTTRCQKLELGFRFGFDWAVDEHIGSRGSGPDRGDTSERVAA